MTVRPLIYPGLQKAADDLQEVALLRNSPNPFIEMTMLWFRLSVSSTVKLTVTNSKGEVAYAHQATYESGEHHLILHRAQLKEAGLYTCQIETPHGTSSRKLMMY